MKRYVVVFEESAQADVRESYDWGRRTWGKHEAQQWVRQLRTAVSLQLTVVPKAFPLAPEDDEFLEEIRQMIVGRYRVLFAIKGRKVHVLAPMKSSGEGWTRRYDPRNYTKPHQKDLELTTS
jgi:plasmid stabilization system protein ParE